MQLARLKLQNIEKIREFELSIDKLHSQVKEAHETRDFATNNAKKEIADMQATLSRAIEQLQVDDTFFTNLCIYLSLGITAGCCR